MSLILREGVSDIDAEIDNVQFGYWVLGTRDSNARVIPFGCALISGNFKAIKMLLRAGANPKHPLVQKLKYKALVLSESELDRLVALEAGNLISIPHAVDDGNISWFSLLERKGLFDPKSLVDGQPILFRAAANPNTFRPMIELLLDRGVDINQRRFGLTLLDSIIFRGPVADLVRANSSYLIAKGARATKAGLKDARDLGSESNIRILERAGTID